MIKEIRPNLINDAKQEITQKLNILLIIFLNEWDYML
jgi:hypothetical protein